MQSKGGPGRLQIPELPRRAQQLSSLLPHWFPRPQGADTVPCTLAPKGAPPPAASVRLLGLKRQADDVRPSMRAAASARTRYARPPSEVGSQALQPRRVC
ncbi:uncharacterized protein UV8b_05156 [Ustilaginoidea virens]|uniref:Uncharacterized protein n=1 Tax=Ustilaginoidea virens TaxID=1159556 RepID=A0A8E5HSN9_USTVR|nr:uncharacterized protein UV8b_05156 [Ustilaginoidea virens]QUC20915.1 hypothetical protein UV8b_05156 [Ustilaginoidea virens]